MILRKILSVLLVVLLLFTYISSSCNTVFAGTNIINPLEAGADDSSNMSVPEKSDTVNNSAPTAGLSFSPKEKVDIAFNIGATVHNDISMLTSKINNKVIPQLQSKGMDVQTSINKSVFSSYGKIEVGEHAIALSGDGTVYTWGRNTSGELGNGSIDVETRSNPIPYLALDNCVDVSAGSGISMALTSAGQVYVWGNNYAYSAGDPGSRSNKKTPYLVQGLSDIVDVEIGDRGTMFAVRSDGSVYSWGANTECGLCGVGNVNSFVTSPALLTSISNVKKIESGNYHTLVLKKDGTVWAWGKNIYGELGNGTTSSAVALTPVQVPGLSVITDISTSYSSNLALKEDGTVWAWGNNNYGTLGDGTTNNRTSPFQVPGLTNITGINMCRLNGWAWKDNGAAYGWGYYFYKLVDPAAVSDILSPRQILYKSNIKYIVSEDDYALCIDSGGKVYAWGRPACGAIGIDGSCASSYPNYIVTDPLEIRRPTGFTDIAGGMNHYLAVKDDGTVWAWGRNTYGQLGNGSTDSEDHPVPAQVPDLTNVIKVFASAQTSFALKSDGTLWAWGHNGTYSIGDGTNISRPAPVRVTVVDTVRDMDISANGTCIAVRTDGSVVTWGSFFSLNFTEVGFTDAVRGEAGSYHYLVLCDNGDVYAWSVYNGWGQVGDGTTNNVYTPKKVLSGASDISAGGTSSMAVLPNGNLYVWGLTNESYDWGTLTSYTPKLLASGVAHPGDNTSGGPAGLVYNSGDIALWGHGYMQPCLGCREYVSAPLSFGFSGGTKVEIGSDMSLALRNDGTLWFLGRQGSTYSYDFFTPLNIPGGTLLLSGTNNTDISTVLEGISWRTDSRHFFVNLQDSELPELNSGDKLTAAISGLAEHSTEYIALGTSVNQNQAGTFIVQNGGNGAFYINTDLDSALSDTVGYVTEAFSPRADVYINIGNTAQNNIDTINTLIDSTLLPALKSSGINSRIIVENGAARTVTQVLGSIPWRSSAKRFFINISDMTSPELDTLADTLVYGSIYYCGLGTAVNQAQIDGLILDNNSNGLFINNTDMPAAMSNLASYISSLFDNTETASFVLAGDTVEYKAFYNDAEIDPRYVSRWKYVHDPYYFDNTNGIIPDSGIYRDFSYNSFDKVGRYTALFQVKDNPKAGSSFDSYRLWSDDTEFKTVILVHRRPVAQFTAAAAYNPVLGYYIPSVTDASYDLDHTSRIDRGIIKKAYQWKEISDSVWKDGLPSSLSANKTYLIKLTVTDMEKAESEPCVKTINTGTGNNPPVAQFVISPNPVKVNQTAVVTDNSYDPDGNPIIERVWTLYKANILQYTGAAAPVNYSAYGAGDYTLKLKVKDSPGAWSEEYSQDFSVINDSLPPLLNITPTNRDWANTGVDISVSASDSDSGIKEVRYCWSASPDKPSTGWLTSTTGVFSSVQSVHGIWHFHVEAFDNSIYRNNTYLSGGPYKIDKLPPIATYTVNPSGWTNTNVEILLSAADPDSGVSRIKLPDGIWHMGSEAVFSVSENGTFNFAIEDIAGNTSIIPVEVSNSDRLPPSGSFDPFDRNWSRDDITVTFTPSDTGGSGVKGWRYRLSGDDGKAWGEWSAFISGEGSRTLVLNHEGKWKIQCEVYDNAGNAGVVESSTLRIDSSPPSGVFIPENSNWTSEYVSVLFDPCDSGSGVCRWRYRTSKDNGSSWSVWSSYVPGDTSGSVGISSQGLWRIQAEVADNAGNMSVVLSGAYPVDKENPTGMFTPNNHAWTSNNILVSFDPYDTGGSGLFRWRYRLSSNSGASWGAYSPYVEGDVSGTIALDSQGIWLIEAEVSDKAGNTVLVSSGAYCIDKSNPAGKFAPNGQNWTNNNISVLFDPIDTGGSSVKHWRYRTSSDNGSGWSDWSSLIYGVTGQIIRLDAGGSWIIQSEVYDVAGNSSIITSESYRIDKIKPCISFTPDKYDWTNRSVMVGIQPGDEGGSGVFRWRYRTSSDGGMNWGSWSTYVSGNNDLNTVLADQGIWLIQVEVSDTAGNTAIILSGEYKIDKTAPSGSFIPGSCRWTCSDTAVSIIASDTGGSGVSRWRYRLSADNGAGWDIWSDYTEGGAGGVVELTGGGLWLIQVEITDAASNQALLSSGLYRVDKTPPAGTFYPASANWTNAGIDVIFTPEDAGGSGADRWRYRLSGSSGSSWEEWSGFYTGEANGNISLESQGIWRLQVELFDRAGNSTFLTSGDYKIDRTLPDGTFSPYNAAWTNNDVLVCFAPSDYGGSGVRRWRYRHSFDDGLAWSAYSSCIIGNSVSTICFSGQGLRKLEVEIEDNAGNIAVLTSGTYFIDKTLPYIDCNPVSRGWSNTDAAAVVSAGDAHSGLLEVRYCWSTSVSKPSAGWSTTYSPVFSTACGLSGVYYLHLEARDRAGNTFYRYGGPYRIDRIPPEIVCIPGTLKSISAPIVVSIASEDAHSGVSHIEYSWSLSAVKPLTGWVSNYHDSVSTSLQQLNKDFYLHIRVFDNAGNSSYRCAGPYRVILEALDFTITSILDVDWRGFYFDLLNPVNGNGELYGYPKRENTVIKTSMLPVNSLFLVDYPVKSVKAGYRVKGYVRVEGSPDKVSFSASYMSGGSVRSSMIDTAGSDGYFYFEWTVPADTDNDSLVSFDIRVEKGQAVYGNEIWTDMWPEKNDDRSVFYIKGNTLQDLRYNQSH